MSWGWGISWIGVMGHYGVSEEQRINRKVAMDQKTEVMDWADRVASEADGVELLMDRLRAFIETPPFFELAMSQRELLRIQLTVMDTYAKILRLRLAIKA